MDMKEESYSVASEVLYSTKLGDKTEILYIVEEKYEWDDPNDAGGYVRKTDKYHSKLTYDSVTGLFDGFIIYKVNITTSIPINVVIAKNVTSRFVWGNYLLCFIHKFFSWSS